SHILEVQVDSAPRSVNGTAAADAPATGVSYRLGANGFLGSKPGWHALDELAPNRYLIPLEKTWGDLTWLGMTGGRGVGLIRHTRLVDLPKRIEQDAVVHVWQLPARERVSIRTVTSAGA